jgi:SAM-dependent methyltransferase
MAKNPTKELYGQLRQRSCEELWHEEVPRFNRASSRERVARVALVRAVGVVFSESGTAEQKAEARKWLTELLKDPEEKIRRYAMTALPKLGGGAAEEAALLSLLQAHPDEREKKFLEESLRKIGGEQTLQSGGLSPLTQQKVQAAVIRHKDPTVIRRDIKLAPPAGLRIHLRCRKGLEPIVREELETSARTGDLFRVAEVRPGLVAITPLAPFSLDDLYALRCFGTLGFVLSQPGNKSLDEETLAGFITSPTAREIFRTFTAGPIRYRLDFIGRGHQRGAIRQLADRVFALCPEILNDARSAPWAVEICNLGGVELRPRFVPDPRFVYREQDVPAASHPPLAASLARVAELGNDEVVWDPFCGSGLELIEGALLGGMKRTYGTDLSAAAIEITKRNWRAAGLASVSAEFVCSDFRDFARKLGRDSVSLILTNPPLGRRVPIASLRQLFADLFSAAATVLRPEGRLVFINPLPAPGSHPALELLSRRKVDLGGFECRMEKYRKRG